MTLNRKPFQPEKIKMNCIVQKGKKISSIRQNFQAIEASKYFRNVNHFWMGISPQECQCFTVSGRVNGIVSLFWGFPGSPAGKESACNPGDLSSIPRSGRSPGEGIGYPLQHSWASLVAQMVKNLPAMRKTWVQSLGWEDPLEDTATTPVFLPGESPWTVACQPPLSIGSQRVGQD